jgi:putative hydrolase of the HAD superfamily
LIEATESVGEVYRRMALRFDVDLPAWRLEDGFRRVLRHAPTRGTDGDTIEARRQGEIDWWFEIIRQTFQATDSTVRFPDFSTFATTLFEAYREAGAWRVRDDMRKVLDALQAADCPLAIISNFDHRLPDVLAGLEIEHYFTSIILPSETGVAKPARAPFEAAANALACPLSNMAYVGDDAPERLEQISAYGIRVFDIRTLEDSAELTDQLLGSP